MSRAICSEDAFILEITAHARYLLTIILVALQYGYTMEMARYDLSK